MITVGVTGPIGSGKSTVCKEWERFGVPVFYADEEAKKLMVSNPLVKKKLIETFGPDTYLQDGSLNKPHLIREAFENERTAELNGIVHPAVAEAFRDFCDAMRQKGEKIVVKEAALLLNNGRPNDIDNVVIVISPEKQRIARVINRDGVTKAHVVARNRNQPDFSRLLHLADYVLENNSSLTELQVKAEKLYRSVTGRP